MDHATKLITKLLSGSRSGEVDSRLIYELLTQYQRGSPVESLQLLLSSSDERLVAEGAWIASELPEEGKPLLCEVSTLLGHSSKSVRFWALDCILLWASPLNGNELASAVALVDDNESAVRWKAMGFLSMASREQLQAALDKCGAMVDAMSLFVGELKWLLGSESKDSRHVSDEIKSVRPLRRRVAAAAAVRMARNGELGSLNTAIYSNDPDIAQFAIDMRQRLVSE